MDLKKFAVVKNLIVTPKSKNLYDKFGVLTFETGIEFNKVENGYDFHEYYKSNDKIIIFLKRRQK